MVQEFVIPHYAQNLTPNIPSKTYMVSSYMFELWKKQTCLKLNRAKTGTVLRGLVKKTYSFLSAC